MKKEFIGFYDPTAEEVEKAWREGFFAFDANTLLNLYRYTDDTRKDFLNSLKAISKKIFIPNQAAYEYLDNRVGVIDNLEFAYTELKSVLEENFEKTLENQINRFKKHPSIVVANIFKLHEDFIIKVSKELERQKKKHPNFKEDDYILKDLTDLFEKSVGKGFSKEELKKIYAEGKDRYQEQIPPGFKDLDEKKKKGDRNVYGDLIIWKELIEYSKKSKTALVFVTDDRKEDWWKIEKGKTIRPREELIKEFYDLTGIRILIYNADQFLKFAKERGLIPTIKEETIEEVKDIRISDEARNIRFYDISEINNTWYNTGENTREIMNRLSNIDRINKIISNDTAQTYKNLFGSINDNSFWRVMNPVPKIKNENNDLLNEDDENK